MFVHEGQLADVFTPGLYMLETNNMPIMTTLQHWDHGFKSPFKSEIYFVNTTRFSDLKWGTKNPVIVRDPEFGPVRLRAFGTYSVRVSDPAVFLREIVGTDGEFTMDEISFQIRNIIVQEFSRTIARASIPVLDMAANTRELGKLVGKEIEAQLAEYGLSLPELYVENISLPPPVEHVWHIAEGGATTGPYSKARMGRMVTEGTLKRDTFVWTAGQDGWKRADEVMELAQLFTVMPPPPARRITPPLEQDIGGG